MDGKPAVGATVSLHPASGPATAARPVGQVDETGTFRLTTAEAGDGAPPGEYKVTVTWFGKPASKRVAPENDDRPVQNLLSPKYAKPESTPLTVTVSAEQTEPLTLDLKRN